MNPILKTKIASDRRVNERGAALITTLLISTLLMIVGGALILTTSMSAVLAVDSTAELQAYYSAEAGVNAAVNVLRGNVQSNPANTDATLENAKANPTLALWMDYNTTINGTSAVSLSNNPVLGYSITTPPDPDGLIPPHRLLLQVTGYGPKGATKQMEVMVDRHIFDYSALSTILIRGHQNDTTRMTFGVGDSAAKDYWGTDQATGSSKVIPVIGVTHAEDKDEAETNILGAKPGTVVGSQQVKQFAVSQLPAFLQTADNARVFLEEQKEAAGLIGRYFGASSGTFGTKPDDLTFIDGDCNLDGGAGLLIVTGNLTLDGGVDFNGLVLVLGAGSIVRQGSGNGDIFGAFAVARFDRTWPIAQNNLPHDFREPTFNTSGGGTGKIAFDSSKVDEALSSAPPRVVAIREHRGDF